MARRVKSEGFSPIPVVDGQPRGMSGPSDVDLDGSRLGGNQEFRYATGGETVRVGDWGLEMLRGRHRERTKKG